MEVVNFTKISIENALTRVVYEPCGRTLGLMIEEVDPAETCPLGFRRARHPKLSLFQGQGFLVPIGSVVLVYPEVAELISTLEGFAAVAYKIDLFGTDEVRILAPKDGAVVSAEGKRIVSAVEFIEC